MVAAAQLSRPQVALTFDTEHPDHPSDDPVGNAYRLLSVLGEYRVRATFFVQGAWARSMPNVAAQIVADGHLIGNHSHSHCAYTGLTNAGIAADLEQSRTILDEFAPTADRFRLPFGAGAQGPEAGRIKQGLAGAGYQHVGWSCGENDWVPGISSAEVAQPIIDAAINRAGVCVPVLHSWPDPTSEAVRTIIDRLKGSADFVCVDALTA